MQPALLFVFILTIVFVSFGKAQPSDFHAVNFSKADSVASLYPNHSLRNLPDLSYKLTNAFQTEPEKFRAIFRWVCRNITNDYNLYATNKKKRETLSGDELKAWNKDFNTVAFKQLLNTHATVCTGYAYLIRELSLHAGLSCEIVDGYGRNVAASIGGKGIVNHSWNVVKLDGKWYLCDATWASGAIDPQQKTFVQKYNDAYFLSEPALFIRNHYPLDTSRTLIDHPPLLTDFLNAPLIYVAAIREGIRPLEPVAFELRAGRGETQRFILAGPLNFPKKLTLRVGHHRTNEAFTAMTSGEETHYTLSHTFRQRGKFAVHVMVDDEYLYSWRVVIE